MAPILPGLSDDPARWPTSCAPPATPARPRSGRTSSTCGPGTREHFLENLARDWPDLLPLYERLYAGRAYVTKETLEPVRRQVRELARRHGLAIGDAGRSRRRPNRSTEQLPLTAFLQAPGVPPA